ncbi:MAG: carboxylating nicotinate-nucleotide diphosphorylase [Candidatus Omnitrophica bacterium]|nr:carboxylating nicotinate-nucleotide diphosphorylase [Candidatus Omnitrophota bacterium]
MNIQKETHLVRFIKSALAEDIGRGDVTTNAIIAPRMTARAIIIAKERGVLCGIDVARTVFRLVDRKIRFQAPHKDGSPLRPGTIIATLHGSARNILKAERTALNFLAHLSGIATATGAFVQAVKPYPTKIMDTRKTIPGLRIFEKYAVRIGGGGNHRMRLGHGILIKENHLVIVRNRDGKSFGFTTLLDKMKKKVTDLKVEIEVENIGDFKGALHAGYDIIMLDNMKLSQIKKAVRLKKQLAKKKKLRRSIILEVSGGVTLQNVRDYAKTGVHWISVGALTHSSRSLDMSLEVL